MNQAFAWTDVALFRGDGWFGRIRVRPPWVPSGNQRAFPGWQLIHFPVLELPAPRLLASSDNASRVGPTMDSTAAESSLFAASVAGGKSPGTSNKEAGATDSAGAFSTAPG